jgi:hypothetical protein
MATTQAECATIEIEDPLKPLSEICHPDPRHVMLGIGIQGIHAALLEMQVTDRAPANVRQLFETAKNVALYTWFVFRFHQVSEMVAYSALELALRERAGFVEWDLAKRRRPPTLRPLLELARREGWLKNERFPSLRELARERVRTTRIERLISKNPSAAEIRVPDPSIEEIEEAMGKIDMVAALLEAAPLLRNELAHGSSMLSPRSLVTLRRIAEAINQLFGVAE